MKSLPPMKVTVLGLLNVTLLISSVYIWTSGQRRVREPSQLAIHAIAPPDLALAIMPPIAAADVNGIREQAVFHSRRSFYQPPPPSQILPTPDYELSGTMDLPQGKRVAFLKKKSDQSSHALHLGEDLEGWRVQSIDPASVVIVRGDQQVELHAPIAGALSGLVRSGAPPRMAQSGPRILGAQGPAPLVSPHNVITEVRTFRPPPH